MGRGGDFSPTVLSGVMWKTYLPLSCVCSCQWQKAKVHDIFINKSGPSFQDRGHFLKNVSGNFTCREIGFLDLIIFAHSSWGGNITFNTCGSSGWWCRERKYFCLPPHAIFPSWNSPGGSYLPHFGATEYSMCNSKCKKKNSPDLFQLRKTWAGKTRTPPPCHGHDGRK